MKELLDYSIPVFHPLAVHFPVALLPLALVVVVLWVIKPKDVWGKAALLVLGFAAVGSIVAFLTGDALYAQSEGVPVVELFVDRHRQLGRFVMIAAGASFLSAFASLFLSRKPVFHRQARLVRILCLCLVILTTALVAITSHVGGVMVWGEYVG